MDNTTKREFYLEPLHEDVKSYYKKALVTMINEQSEEYDTIAQLTSYETIVAQVNQTTNKAEIFGTYSMTTLRHIKEFLNQQGFEVGTKAQLEKMYLVKN